MVQIGGKPMLWHIMDIYARYNHKNFFVALGHKGEIIKQYFSQVSEKWNINLIDTGQKTMTGGRVKRIQKFIGNETFMLTYGDGLANINLKSLLSFHKKHGKLATMTAVTQPGRYGSIKLSDDGTVLSFQEKPKLPSSGFINAGIYVFSQQLLADVKNLQMGSLEQDVLQKLPIGKLNVFSGKFDFLDIGTPEDYVRAQIFFRPFLKRWNSVKV